jgi:hypothetical protein
MRQALGLQQDLKEVHLHHPSQGLHVPKLVLLDHRNGEIRWKYQRKDIEGAKVAD